MSLTPLTLGSFELSLTVPHLTVLSSQTVLCDMGQSFQTFNQDPDILIIFSMTQDAETYTLAFVYVCIVTYNI